MLHYYNPDTPPSIFLQGYLDGYEQEFREYWRLDESDSDDPQGELYRMLDGLAEYVVRAAQTLTDDFPGRARIEKTWEIAQESHDAVATFLDHRLELAFAAESVEEIYQASQRAEKLLGHLVRVETERARAYLHRVATCYLRGLETETLVMAGAVIETAMEDACPPDAVRDRIPGARDKKDKWINMRDRLNFLTTVDDVDVDVISQAEWVWEQRGKAVHGCPGVEPPMDDVLEALVLVLNGLQGAED